MFVFRTFMLTFNHLQVVWEPFTQERLGQLQLSFMCNADDDLYMMLYCSLICFYAMEFHLPQQVARQFGLRQEWPVRQMLTFVELHK